MSGASGERSGEIEGEISRIENKLANEGFVARDSAKVADIA
ncbi:hypothetical protein ACVXG9_02270 [Escherichia coli]